MLATPRTPRCSPLSGLSSQGTLLLALGGAGIAVFLLFLFPRMATSRAATARSTASPAHAQPAPPPSGVEVVELVQDDPLDSDEIVVVEADGKAVQAAGAVQGMAGATALTADEPAKKKGLIRGERNPEVPSQIASEDLQAMRKSAKTDREPPEGALGADPNQAAKANLRAARQAKAKAKAAEGEAPGTQAKRPAQRRQKAPKKD